LIRWSSEPIALAISGNRPDAAVTSALRILISADCRGLDDCQEGMA
jgi:hypothetical protein